MKDYLDGRVMVKSGDITDEKVDAIVNAANSTLMGGGGVDGAIHRAGGPDILEACKKVRRDSYPEGLPTGQAVSTTAGRLPARYVIHTVGPVWHGGDHNEEELLAACYTNSLREAVLIGCATIAFPAVSTGVYGFPKKLAAKIASETVKAFLGRDSSISKVVFVFFGDDAALTFKLNQVFEN